MLYLLDTDTCIEAMHGNPHIVERMARVSPDDCGVSAVTVFELHTGLGKCSRPSEETVRLRKLLAGVRELPFDSPAATEAGAIRVELEKSGVGIGPYDTLIAGHARVLALILVTANTHEFSRVADLAFENWRRP